MTRWRSTLSPAGSRRVRRKPRSPSVPTGRATQATRPMKVSPVHCGVPSSAWPSGTRRQLAILLASAKAWASSWCASSSTCSPLATQSAYPEASRSGRSSAISPRASLVGATPSPILRRRGVGHRVRLDQRDERAGDLLVVVTQRDQFVDQAEVQMPAAGNLLGEVVAGDEPADPLREVAPALLELLRVEALPVPREPEAHEVGHGVFSSAQNWAGSGIRSAAST